MTENIQAQLDFFVRDKAHHSYRKPASDPDRYAKLYRAEGLGDRERAARRLRDMLREETPVVFPWEHISLLRTVPTVPEIFTEEERAELARKHYIHEQGKVCNVCPDYMLLMSKGLDSVRADVVRRRDEFRSAGDADRTSFESVLIDTIDAVLEFSDRYRTEAERVGNKEVADTLSRIPRRAPETFAEALQFLRLLHYCLWCSFQYHNVLGRFDQYMLPYYRHDLDAGLLDQAGALELLEEFFISLNRDSDLYPGMQQGDNGQSMVLGGTAPDGSDCFNDLSDLCLQASLELKLIDPKINLRVSSKTPLETYVKGSRLTAQGLGFPQYSNDDVVLRALRRWGYREEDCWQYVVAACWEFIIPGYGMDIPNVSSLSFPDCVMRAVRHLGELKSFDELMDLVHEEIRKECDRLTDSVHSLYMEPAPLLSLMMRDTVDQGKDISLGGRYNNFGFHGTGLATAVDSLAAVRRYVFETEEVPSDRLLRALDTDFSDENELCNMLRYEAPKMGNDDDVTDALASDLLTCYAQALEGRTNERGGIYRAGTGSAMYYIWQAREMGATPDGRHAGEEFAANYSPSLFTRLDGPFSIIRSFTKPDLSLVANGGPLTIELSDTLFRSPESIGKTAAFVQAFILRGGHQMQINSVNRDTLLDAKKHPEKYRNLIVRVWGWSGYFVELDECYQNQIIKRMELAF